tara:strand:- start:2065 stop:2487 length:423 start_codon:yes stop_codon:yes gene_type:complete
MKKSDLKNLIKPIVKECINEVLIEEGLLTEVVSQVAAGMSNQRLVENSNAVSDSYHNNNHVDHSERKQKQQESMNRHRQKLLDAIGRDSYNGVNLFEGTTPTQPQESQSAGSVDLGNPSDAGVDISSLMGGASKIWKAMK